MPQTTVSHKEPAAVTVLLAFAGLYIIWGSTYLGIMIAIETIPTFFLVAFRFLLAGGVLLAYCLLKGEKMPSFRSFASIGVAGIFMLCAGNGAVTWAEQYLPSGLAAIVVATVPLWFVVLDRRQWSYHFSNRMIIAGILVGFAGVFLLFSGKGSVNLAADKMKVISFFVLIFGTICWAIGSLYSKYKTQEGSTTMKAAVQMFSAGIVALLIAFLTKEHQHFALAQVSGRSWLALLYLVVMGSLVGYMSYIWLLSVRTPAVVGTYAYVNPIVAVLLGWLILGEAVTIQQVFALAVILIGVILVNMPKKGQVKPT